MAVFVVALTGGIGSGKSAAADAFAARGAAIVDTDAIAHELTGPRGAAMAAIGTAFGGRFIAADGSLDRAAMRSLVFSDAGAKRRLEAILHPLIRAESDRRLAAAGGPYAILVIPLLVESGSERRYSRVLLIDTDEAAQVARVARRGLPEDEIRRIIASQAGRLERRAAADDVLENNGSLEDLERKVEALHGRYLGYAKERSARS